MELEFPLRIFLEFGYTSQGCLFFRNFRKSFFHSPVQISSNSAGIFGQITKRARFMLRKAIREFLIQNRKLVESRLPPTRNGFADTHSLSWAERGTVRKNTAQRPQPGLEPRPLDPESTNHEVTLSSYKLSQELQTATVITKCDSNPFGDSFECPGSNSKKFSFSNLKD